MIGLNEHKPVAQNTIDRQAKIIYQLIQQAMRAKTLVRNEQFEGVIQALYATLACVDYRVGAPQVKQCFAIFVKRWNESGQIDANEELDRVIKAVRYDDGIRVDDVSELESLQTLTRKLTDKFAELDKTSWNTRKQSKGNYFGIKHEPTAVALRYLWGMVNQAGIPETVLMTALSKLLMNAEKSSDAFKLFQPVFHAHCQTMGFYIQKVDAGRKQPNAELYLPRNDMSWGDETQARWILTTAVASVISAHPEELNAPDCRLRAVYELTEAGFLPVENLVDAVRQAHADTGLAGLKALNDALLKLAKPPQPILGVHVKPFSEANKQFDYLVKELIKQVESHTEGSFIGRIRDPQMIFTVFKLKVLIEADASQEDVFSLFQDIVKDYAEVVTKLNPELLNVDRRELLDLEPRDILLTSVQQHFLRYQPPTAKSEKLKQDIKELYQAIKLEVKNKTLVLDERLKPFVEALYMTLACIDYGAGHGVVIQSFNRCLQHWNQRDGAEANLGIHGTIMNIAQDNGIGVFVFNDIPSSYQQEQFTKRLSDAFMEFDSTQLVARKRTTGNFFGLKHKPQAQALRYLWAIVNQEGMPLPLLITAISKVLMYSDKDSDAFRLFQPIYFDLCQEVGFSVKKIKLKDQKTEVELFLPHKNCGGENAAQNRWLLTIAVASIINAHSEFIVRSGKKSVFENIEDADIVEGRTLLDLIAGREVGDASSAYANLRAVYELAEAGCLSVAQLIEAINKTSDVTDLAAVLELKSSIEDKKFVSTTRNVIMLLSGNEFQALFEMLTEKQVQFGSGSVDLRIKLEFYKLKLLVAMKVDPEIQHAMLTSINIEFGDVIEMADPQLHACISECLTPSVAEVVQEHEQEVDEQRAVSEVSEEQVEEQAVLSSDDEAAIFGAGVK